MSYSELQSGTEPPIDPNVPKKKKVVVLGTGWAGTSLLKDLDASLYDDMFRLFRLVTTLHSLLCYPVLLVGQLKHAAL